MRYLIISLLLFFAPTIVFANCDDTLYDKKVASSNLIKTSYNYQASNDKMQVKIMNIPQDFYITMDKTTKKFYPNNKEVVLGNFNQGSSMLVYYYTTQDLGCGRGNLVNRVYINLPYYNPYSNDERCKTRSGLAVCGEYYSMPITKELFEEAIIFYDENNYNRVKTDVKQKKTEVVDPWYYKYRYYLIGGVIFLVGIAGGVIYRIRNDKIGSEL